jgi:geranylgeranyl diphosphate synthase, type II
MALQTNIDTDLSSYMKNKSSWIEQHLDALVFEKDCPYKKLFQACRYSLFSGGKRLRPILTLATAEMLGADIDKAIIPACAIEMIHTYSMIHDDLPCMDDDDFRRGKPSLHKAFTEAEAVLAGDLLLTYAFEVLSAAPQLTANQKVALITLIAKNSGSEGMVAGQWMDITAEGLILDIESLRCIHRYKTGALITASIESGAIVANASPNETLTLREFGNAIGLAFQIIDDVVDVTESHQKHGKAVASDAANNKTTYVSLLGIEGAKKKAVQLLEEGYLHLNKLSRDTSLLAQLARKLVHRKI